jgi:hypothetical protein
MFPEADKFAEELCQFYKSVGTPDELAEWVADSWFNSFHGLYDTSHDCADGIEHIDRMRAILRRDIPTKEKLAQLNVLNPMVKK